VGSGGQGKGRGQPASAHRDEFCLIRVGLKQRTGVTGTERDKWVPGQSSAGETGGCQWWHAAVRAAEGLQVDWAGKRGETCGAGEEDRMEIKCRLPASVESINKASMCGSAGRVSRPCLCKHGSGGGSGASKVDWPGAWIYLRKN
jgi:hypothetical protein